MKTCKRLWVLGLMAALCLSLLCATAMADETPEQTEPPVVTLPETVPAVSVYVSPLMISGLLKMMTA